jgi:hypothetical protein
MDRLIEEFKNKMRSEGRSFKWFHGNYITGVTYSYFIIQLNEKDRLQDSIKVSIEKYLAQK